MFNFNKAKCAINISFTLFFPIQLGCSRQDPGLPLCHCSVKRKRVKSKLLLIWYTGLTCHFFFYLFYGKSNVAIPGSMSSSMSEMQLGSDIFRKYCRAEPKLSGFYQLHHHGAPSFPMTREGI